MSAEAAPLARRARKPLYRDLSVQILVAMLLGVAVGWIWPQSADALKLLGDVFIRLVRMVVAPIIFCTVVHGIASGGQAKSVGRIAVKAIVYFVVLTTLAKVLALVLVNVWAPGAGLHADPASFSDSAPGVAAVEQTARQTGIAQFLINLVPASAIGAFAEGDVLPVLFFSVLFAFALLALGPKGKPIVDGVELLTQVLFKIIGYVMVVAPIGAFGAIAFTVGKYGPSSLIALGHLVAEFYVCCLLFVLLVLWPVAAGFGVNLLKLIRYIGAELMIVAGTSSSESVFPRMIAKLRALGCEERVVALVLPAGYAFNHDGSSLYYATVSVFLAQALGIDLTLSQQIGLVLITLLTSTGGAGVAGGAIVMLTMSLDATNYIPVAAIGMIIGVHRLLSSAFVPVNVLGNALATIVIARLEGALDNKRMQKELEQGPRA
jgi:aerobic C4-dicarboxylate transport protein